MSIFYSDEKREFNGSFDLTRINANKQWNTHYSNMLMLDFITKSTKDGREAAQARSEIIIAEKKMKYWERMPNFCRVTMTRAAAQIKSDWKGR